MQFLLIINPSNLASGQKHNQAKSSQAISVNCILIRFWPRGESFVRGQKGWSKIHFHSPFV